MSTGEKKRPTWVLKACVIGSAAVLFLSTSAIGEEEKKPSTPDERAWYRLTKEALPENVVSVFHWRDTIFATYDASGIIELFDAAPNQSGPLSRIQLDEAPLPSGEIYPDPLFRLGDRIIHLNKAGPELHLYDLSGKLKESFPVAAQSAYWVDESSNRFWILGVDPHSKRVRLASYSKEGRLLETIEPWLRPKPDYWRAGAAFFFFADGVRWELPFFFPFVHREGGQAPGQILPIVDHCSGEFSKNVLSALHEQSESYGAPEPLGTGLDEDPQLNPVILAATRTDNEILFLLNGGVFASLDLTNGRLRCSKLPRPGSEAGWVASSIAAHDEKVVILFRTPQAVDIRVLVQQRESSSNPSNPTTHGGEE